MQWPTSWCVWPLNVVRVKPPQHPADSLSDVIDPSSGTESDDRTTDVVVVDSWGLLSAAVGGDNGGGATSDVGVLVGPDCIVAAVGPVEVIRAWLDKHFSRGK